MFVGQIDGTTDPDGQTPVVWQMTFWRQKEQAHRCLEQMLHRNPEKVILAHGR